MPIFTYKCTQCNSVTEVIQKASDRPLTECLEHDCHGPLEKQIARTAPPKFKGKGFHATDYNAKEGSKK